MASLTIRNLDDGVKARLRVRAAENGHSMEEEARAILAAAVPSTPSTGLGSDIMARTRALGGVDLDPPPRGLHEGRVDFSGRGFGTGDD